MIGKASTEYYNLEKVAEVLSVPAAEVNRLREQGKLRGLRDGNTWKFFKEEVHTYLAEVIKSRSGANSGHKPGDSGFDLGGTSSASSSFDILMEDAALPDDSDLIAVAPVRAASDLDLAALDKDDELSLAEETQISALTVTKKPKPKEAAPPEPSSIIVEDDEDSSALLLAPLEASDALADEDSVLTPSGSSPQLNLTSDSGFDVLVAGEDEHFLLDDDEKTSIPNIVVEKFELEPSPKIQDGEDSESSSQVIAIDAFAGLGQDADPFAKQDDFGAFAGFENDVQQPSQATPAVAINEPFGAGDVFAAATPAVSVTPRKQTVQAEEYSTGTLIALVAALVVMFVPGLMLIDTMVHIWSWGEPFVLNSFLMDIFSKML